jgi:hypothetical protein
MTWFHHVWDRKYQNYFYPVQIPWSCRFTSISTYKMHHSGAIFEFAVSPKYYFHYNIPLANPQPTTHNKEQQHRPLPPYPPVALPSLSVSRAAAPTTHGASTPHGPMQGARHRVTRHRCWFPCLGCQHKPHQNIERKKRPWP